MSANSSKDAIAKAWADHRGGKNDNAVKGFEAALRSAPDDIDALYGLGLAQRALHLYEPARATFQRCASLVKAELARTPGQDRWMMLERMTSQRIAEIDVMAVG